MEPRFRGIATPLGRGRAVALAAAVMLVAACGSSTPTAHPSSAGSPLATPSTSSVTASPSVPPSAAPRSPYDTTTGAAQLAYPHRTVFIQMFEWRWTDIAAECEQWLGPRGFAGVQVSPPNENAVIDTAQNHFPWWQRYQPVSYRLESRSGTRAEFADMVKRCRAAGVDVYADVIINHMASGSGSGNAGTMFDHETFPGLYAPQDFHDTPNPAYPKIFCNSPMNTGDPDSVQTCQLSGLPDLRTEEPKVQAALAAYLADLYGLGVRGFRLDAAKHVASSQVRAILDRLRARLPAGARFFVDQEVTDFGGDAVPKDAYYATGSVDDFVYASDITTAFMHTDETLSSLEHLDRAGFVSPTDHSVPFVDNHDTQRGRFSGILLTYKRADLYTLATTFMLAYPVGYPRLMSSYDFSDTEAGPPSDAAGHTNAVYSPTSAVPNCGLGTDQWVCEQRWQAIEGMVGFRDFTAGSPAVANWWSNPGDGNQIAFGRGGGTGAGSTGFVVINRSTSPLAQTLQTGLPPGTYCNVVAGDLLGTGSCAGSSIAVAADGTAHFELAPVSAAAIHVGARASNG